MISIAARPSIRERFDELYLESETNSKAEFLDMLLDQFAGITDDEPKVNEEDPFKEKEEPSANPLKDNSIVERTRDIIEVDRALADDEILIKLNPVQKFALQKHINNKNFREVANNNAEELLNKRSFWSGELKYPHYFTHYPESLDERQYMGILLVNAYMGALAAYLFTDEVNVEEVREFGLITIL